MLQPARSVTVHASAKDGDDPPDVGMSKADTQDCASRADEGNDEDQSDDVWDMILKGRETLIEYFTQQEGILLLTTQLGCSK